MDDNLFYNMFELGYIKQMKNKKEYKNMSDAIIYANLFPNGWFKSNDIGKKLEYLFMAMDEDKPLVELEGISYFNEGVKHR